MSFSYIFNGKIDVFDVSFVKILKNDGASKWHIF